MSPRKQTSPRAARAAAAGSWLALLAASTLGDAASTVRAEVRAEGLADGSTYRLVVQSFDAFGTRRAGGGPARPVGSAQRAVTADELRHGVQMSLIEFAGGPGTRRAGPGPVVVAWIEAGEPNLEFDGLTARPGPDSLYASVKRGAGPDVVQISLRGRRA
jgi:hypothetical protein